MSRTGSLSLRVFALGMLLFRGVLAHANLSRCFCESGVLGDLRDIHTGLTSKYKGPSSDYIGVILRNCLASCRIQNIPLFLCSTAFELPTAVSAVMPQP